ncbi:anthrax toxin receptor-like [Loxodonta africana]|uniref:anthrax toxin receptor-like n=1 Tax=Loxodonta africana TaxID=9785 RepID=UPI0030CC9912
MASHGPWAPCPAPFLLLLLLPPPPLLPGAGSFGHRGHGSKSVRHRWRQGTGEQISCGGGFDLYLILDKSGSVNNDWMYVFTFAEDIVKNVINPKLRISFIIYATYGTTIMKLSSDINTIEDGLNKLRNVRPQGATYMQEGFKRAIEQMEVSNAGGVKVPTVIIAMTDGTLEPKPLKETVELANKVRSMGVTVYCVGVKEYLQEQLDVIADSKEHAIGVTGGFPALGSVTGEVTFEKELYSNCISGASQYLCRRTVFVEVSLNNGLNFLSNDLSITSTKCGHGFFPGFPNIPLLPVLVPSLLMLPVLLWCAWRLCRKPAVKEPPPLPPSQPIQSPPPKKEEPEKEETMPPTKCPTLVFPCCGCPGVEEMKRMQCKLDALYTLVNQSCIQLSPCDDRQDDAHSTPHDWMLLVQFLYGMVSKGFPMPLPDPVVLLVLPQQGRCISFAGGVKCQCMQMGKCEALTCCPRCQHPPRVHSQPPCRMLPLVRFRTRSLSGPPLALPPSVAPTLKH